MCDFKVKYIKEKEGFEPSVTFVTLVFKTRTLNHSDTSPIGITGFEPVTLASQMQCATKLRYIPLLKQYISIKLKDKNIIIKLKNEKFNYLFINSTCN